MEGSQTPTSSAGAGALYAQFSAFVAEFKAARPHVFGPRPAPVRQPEPPFDIEAARAELEQLQRTHDSAFNYSDDHSVWAKGQREADRIAYLRGAIHRHTLEAAA